MSTASAQHRKSVRHYDLPGHVHELTFSCFKRRPLLLVEERCRALARCIDAAAERHRFHIHAFVFMPTHVHLLVRQSASESRVAAFLLGVKKPASMRVKAMLAASDPLFLQSLTVQERPGKFVFRFWQEGPGYDRNLVHDAAIRGSIDYIHLNPVRGGLSESPGAWKWSSWSAYHRRNHPQDTDLPIVAPLLV